MPNEDPRIIALQYRVKMLQRLSKKWRDHLPGTPEWMTWWTEYPADQEAMAVWARGPTTLLQPFDSLYALGDQIEAAERDGVSFILVEDNRLLGLNAILSILNCNCRIALRCDQMHLQRGCP